MIKERLVRVLKQFLIIGCALVLTACAHPDFIKLGTSYDAVRQELGAPDAQTLTPEGNIRMVYSMQPMGQQSYAMIFDKNTGKLISKENILYEQYYVKNIKPTVMSEQDIFNMFGRPCEQWTYKLLKEHTYMYRFAENGFDLALWVDFDNETSHVLRWVISLDPWTQRDADWDNR